MPESQTDDTMIAALLRERAGYVQRGLDDRVAQVDEQLKLRGYKPTRGRAGGKSPAAPDPGADDKTPPEGDKPKGRQQPSTQKT